MVYFDRACAPWFFQMFHLQVNLQRERERERTANLAVGSSIDNRQTFGSILGGYGSPVMITARPLLLAKSNPSLTYTEQQGKTSNKSNFVIIHQQMGYNTRKLLQFVCPIAIHNLMSPPKKQCTEHEGASLTVKFTIFLQSLSHLSSAHSKENGSVSFGVVDSLIESIHCLFIIKNPVITGCWWIIQSSRR